jgi:hypothetical protein
MVNVSLARNAWHDLLGPQFFQTFPKEWPQKTVLVKPDILRHHGNFILRCKEPGVFSPALAGPLATDAQFDQERNRV